MPDFEALVESSPNLHTVFDDAGTVRYQNGAIERLCGRDPDAVVGESFFEYVHPADRDRLEAALLNPDRSSADAPLAYRFRHADGSWVRLETTGEPRPQPEPGAYGVVSRGIGDRVARERALERYEAILDSLDDAVYAIEPDGTIAYVNDAYASLKGVEPETLLGTDIYEWGSADAIERIRAAREELEANGRDTGVAEFEFSTADGGSVPVEMRFGTVDRPDDEIERVGVVRDVTERRAREAALRRKNERLEAFADIVSHDLRNPLSVAQGNLDLARAAVDDEHLEEVAAAHDRMAALIDGLLTLAREGRAVADPSAVDLASAVERGWRSVDTGAADLLVETDRTVVADGSRLRQLLENLVRNAVEHGGSAPTVTVGDLADGFFVEADGPGIPPADRERVFETGYTTASDGTGYGLGIVERIADAHGWSITVTEGTAGGARFEITGVEFTARDRG